MSNHDNFTHDVFLSFRGATRYNFTGNLYKALVNHRINVFRDDENLKIGDEIEPSLLQAIEASRVSIVVLCQDYASSTWCLDELVKIVDGYEKKGKSVYVVFYKVEPSDVRHQRNSYEIDMMKHEERFGKQSEKVKEWKSALNRVCALSGLHYKGDIYEYEFIENIVRDISAKLPPTPLQIIKHEVGLDSRFEQVKSIIDIDSDDVFMFGIHGAGGIGKTTLALYIYNKISIRFEAASFLYNIREKSNQSTMGLEDLQMRLLNDMGVGTQTMMGSTFRGCSEIKRKLSHKRVLLILDDIDSVKQLQSLAGGHDWFGSGSIIIVTTRDTEVLHKHDIKIKRYKLEELNYIESVELFCRYAFNMSTPAEGFENVSSCAISYAKGIPLALSVIGSNLNGKSIEECNILLQKYRKVPNADIQGALEISYKCLSDFDKKIFLDIACFFKGERWDYVKRILEACDFYPVISVFVSKCLITIDENGCLEMHDLIQDMGREIVRKKSKSNPGERSRLWYHKEVLDVLKGDLGSTTIEGIMLHPPKQEKVDHWAYTAFEKMKNLRILIVRNTLFSSGPSFLPNSLRVLDWKSYPSHNFLPDFHPYRIVDFNLPHSSIILKKPFQKFEDLTFINLSHSQSITQIPDLSGAKSLRVLRVDECHKLVKFDKSIGLMPHLVYLSASRCTKLKIFVPTMYLPSLQVISFNLCKNFEHFPHIMQKMDSPLKIHMRNTSIKELPESIGNLTGLEFIDMSFCKGLKDLSSRFFLLPKLITLKIDGCCEVGESFQRFKEGHLVENVYPNLETLHFSEANLSFKDIHAIIENFPKLEDFKMSHNGFEILPKCIRGSLHLKNVDVSFCKNLREVPELPLSIQKIDATHCQSLTLEASSLLWSKVSQEIQRIQVVMPMLKEQIPEWFDFVSTQEIPLLLARRKFPVFALALVFQEEKKAGHFPKLNDGIELSSGVVSLHLFINAKEICVRDCNYFYVGPNHVLLCDLRVLFSDEEWKDLDANLGDDWKAIQVQYDSSLILTNWGVYMYKKETNMDDIQFINPDCSSFSYTPSSFLVPKTSPEHKFKYMLKNMSSRCMFSVYFQLIVKEKRHVNFSEVVSRALGNSKDDSIWKASSSSFGLSLKQDQEDSIEDVVKVLEIIKENLEFAPKHIVDSYAKVLPIGLSFVELLLRAQLELAKEGLDLTCPIVLVYTNKRGYTHRRFWGLVKIKLGDPLYKPMLRKIDQILWGHLTSNGPSSFRLKKTILELKCQRPMEEETSSSSHNESLDEGNHNPEIEAFLRKVEQDVMSLNKSYGKMEASIVQTDESFDEFIYRTVITYGRFASPCKLKITTYGKIRTEDDYFLIPRACFWCLSMFLFVLMAYLFISIRRVCLWFYRIPLTQKITVLSLLCKLLFFLFMDIPAMFYLIMISLMIYNGYKLGQWKWHDLVGLRRIWYDLMGYIRDQVANSEKMSQGKLGQQNTLEELQQGKLDITTLDTVGELLETKKGLKKRIQRIRLDDLD